MSELKKTSNIGTTKPSEFGDSEAAKLFEVLNDQKQSVDYSLQQTIRIEKQTFRKFRGEDRNHVRLGPCLKPEKVEEVLEPLKECFPAKFTKPPFLNEPEKLVCHWVTGSNKTGSNKPINGWTCSIDTRSWFDRLSSRHDCWRKLRIYELLRLSTYPSLPFYNALTAGLVCCWNPCLNVFVTGQGFRTITLEDIAFLTGLSPTGIDLPTQSLIDGALDMEKTAPWKNKSNMSFRSIVDYYNPGRNRSLSAEISRKEEVLFINFALCKLMMFPSCNVNKTFLKLAANIEASGLHPKRVEPLCLAPLFLGQVYRCLYRLRTQDKFYTAGGPVWIISMWGRFYFPRVVRQKYNKGLEKEKLKADIDMPAVLPVNECCCYGEVAIHTNSPVVHLTFEEVIRGLLYPCELSQADWHPFSGKDEMYIPLYLHDTGGSPGEDISGEWMKTAAPVWLLELSCMRFREGDQQHWSAVLQPRDLMCLEPQLIGVEVYNPNLVARQFGMTQGLGIPYYKTLNRPWGTRPNLLDMAPKSGDNKFVFAETWLKSFSTYGLTSHHITPWFRWAAVDPGYELWWFSFLQSFQISWPEAIATLVQRVQGRPTSILQAFTTKRLRTSLRTTIVSGLTKCPSQIEKIAETYPGTRSQKRKSEKITGASISPLLKKAVVKEVEEADENAPLRAYYRRRTSQARHAIPGDSLMNGQHKDYPDPIISGFLKDLQHKRPDVVLALLDIPREKNNKKKVTPQNPEPDVSSVRLNIHKELEKEVEKKGTSTTQGFHQGTSRSASACCDYLDTIISEEAVVESMAPEPEDSLESPHEMVRGMGCSNLDAAFSIPPEDPDQVILDAPAICLSCSSSLRADDLPLIKEEDMEEESGAHDPVTPDMSRALVVGSSSPQGVSFTPDKALAEVNSVMSLIKDSLRPLSVPSAFDVEKEKSEKILNILQSNMRDLAAYADLADQLHRLLAASPPQFRPILAHYQTSFLSLSDQLRNLGEHEDSMTSHANTLNDLNNVAKDLRARLENSQGRIDQLRVQCSEYDKEIDELETKLLNLRQLRESKQQELAIEEHKFAEASSAWSDTIPSLQEVAKSMVAAHQTKVQWECTLKTIKDNVHSFLELLRTM